MVGRKGVYGAGSIRYPCRMLYEQDRLLCSIGLHFAADVFGFWRWAFGISHLGSLLYSAFINNSRLEGLPTSTLATYFRAVPSQS